MPYAPSPLVFACLLASACATAGPVRTYVPTGDYETSTPPSRAEGGHTAAVVPPAGISWTQSVLAHEGETGGDASRYEFRVDVVDREAPAGSWRIEPVFEGAELVDDEGGRFRCTKGKVPTDPSVAADAVPARSYGFVFEVPASYRFSRIGRLAVHWGFVLDGRTWRITTRFRDAWDR